MPNFARVALFRARKFVAVPALSLLWALALSVGGADPADASTNRQIVVDPATGMALYGYDPVAYFIDGKAHLGKIEFERDMAGVSWRFVNQGNMQAFFDAPDIYCPRYGGYGALSVAKGLATEGKPIYFVIRNGKLYFFYSPANRRIWLDDPETYIAEADRQWETVRDTLAR